MLRSLGRMGAFKEESVRKELIASLLWAGDPGMAVKSGEGAYLGQFDKEVLETLIKYCTTAASYMMVNFGKRMVRVAPEP